MPPLMHKTQQAYVFVNAEKAYLTYAVVRASIMGQGLLLYSCCCFLLLLLLFLTFSALVANPKKTTLHGGQSRSWSAEQGKKGKERVWQRPPTPARCSFGEKKKGKKGKSRDASTCLGATQVGVTQVVSVRLASVQGFLRLVS